MNDIPEWIRQTYICLLKKGNKATDFIVAKTLHRSLQKSGINFLIRKGTIHANSKNFKERNFIQEHIDSYNK